MNEDSVWGAMPLTLIIMAILMIVASYQFEPEINTALGTETVENIEEVEVYDREKELNRNSKSLYTKVFSDTIISEKTHVSLMGKSEKRAVKEEYPEMKITNSMENTNTTDKEFDYFVETEEEELYYLDIELNYLEGDTVERQLVEEGTELHNEYLGIIN